jgi:uncharacterized membrane protein
VLAEVPRINRHLPLLKIIAAVAPLMGLLGTVTGMIVTFQAITLFGAGDPRLMAGGISQALITTVLGLCVAIPMLLLHNLVQGRARGITELLQQRAVALVAERAELRRGRNRARARRGMSALIEAFAPWLGDLLELGGPILGIILCIAFVMWLLLFERVSTTARGLPARSRRSTAPGKAASSTDPGLPSSSATPSSGTSHRG